MKQGCQIVAVLIFTLASSFTFAASSFLQCRTPQIDIEKMIAALESLSIPENQTLPKYTPEQYSDLTLRLTKEPAPQEAHDLFFRMQDRLFGKQLLKLETYTDFNFEVAYERHSILINPTLWTAILQSPDIKYPHNTLRFILAHEVGHYVQSMVAIKNKTFFSVNGHLVSATASDNDFENYINNSLKKMGLPTQDAFFWKLFDQFFEESHVEVDIYAYLILKKIGGKPILAADLLQIFNLMETLEASAGKKQHKSPPLSKKDAEDFKFLKECSLRNREESLRKYYLSDYLDNKLYLLPTSETSAGF